MVFLYPSGSARPPYHRMLGVCVWRYFKGRTCWSENADGNIFPMLLPLGEQSRGGGGKDPAWHMSHPRGSGPQLGNGTCPPPPPAPTIVGCELATEYPVSTGLRTCILSLSLSLRARVPRYKVSFYCVGGDSSVEGSLLAYLLSRHGVINAGPGSWGWRNWPSERINRRGPRPRPYPLPRIIALS